MRLIDADELPKVKFHALPYTHIVPSDLKDLQSGAYQRGWNDAIDAVVECAETAQQWIPVTERLPKEERKSYWVCTDTEYQCECRWTNNCFGIGESHEWGWSIFDIPRFSHVVAWRELPEPWKGWGEK